MRNLRRAAVFGGAGLAGLAVAALATLAFARTSHTTLRTARVSALHASVLADSKGRTLYVLKPETTRHLLCKTSACFGAWPPDKVSRHGKLTAARGIKGKLGRLHRKGFWQLTLGRSPLYRFAGDGGKAGQANGNGIPSFGGTWHVVKVASSGSHHTGTTTTTKTTKTSTSPCSVYCYPG